MARLSVDSITFYGRRSPIEGELSFLSHVRYRQISLIMCGSISLPSVLRCFQVFSLDFMNFNHYFQGRTKILKITSKHWNDFSIKETVQLMRGYENLQFRFNDKSYLALRILSYLTKVDSSHFQWILFHLGTDWRIYSLAHSKYPTCVLWVYMCGGIYRRNETDLAIFKKSK